MRQVAVRLLAAGVLCALAGAGLAFEPPADAPAPESIKLPPIDAPPLLKAEDSAKDILRKVIEAYGGADKQKRWNRGYVRFRMKAAALGRPASPDMVWEEYFDYPGRLRRVATGQKDGEKATMTFVINKDGAWVHDDVRGVRQLPRASQASADKPEHVFAQYNNFTHFQGEGIGLARLDNAVVDDRPVAVLRVTGEGRPEAAFSFDRGSGLCLKSRVANTQPKLIPGDFVETTYADYKRFQGMAFPTKIRGTGDGKPVVEVDVLNLTFPDKLDDALFAKPG
jgi:hypothetical protein